MTAAPGPATPAAAARTPLVTVGLAVYNGEEFLDEAIRSIRAQTLTDFELVISDNCSTDATAEICARHVADDPRLRYHRNPVNVGGVRNENRTMFLARGTYFKLAAHDDTIEPRFLERCVAVLEADPSADVCYTAVRAIDATGTVIGERYPTGGTEATAHERIAAVSHRDYTCESTYGVVRTSTLREVRPQANHLHSDRVVLSELAARGPFRFVEEPLFNKRHHDANVYRDWRGRSAWFQPELTRTGGIRLPHFRQSLDYVTLLGRIRVPLVERVRCAGVVAWWHWHMRRSLAMDVVDAIRMLLIGGERRRRRYVDEASWR